MTKIMRHEITLNEMHEINLIINHVGWKINIPLDTNDFGPLRENLELDKSNQFINDLFSCYRSEKLSVYKKIFNYCFQNNIDLLSTFTKLRVTNTRSHYFRYPEYLDLINYCYQKNLFLPGHDFSVYFTSFLKPTKTNVLARVKLLSAFSTDISEKSFNLYCSVFNDYLKVEPIIPVTFQTTIQKMFSQFDNQDFFITRSNEHDKFYPSLLIVDNLSNVQKDSFFSKRFCFEAQHSISTVTKNLENSLEFIYNTVFNNLKDKDVIQDYYTSLEQGSFYLYVFSNDSKKIENIGYAVKAFHKEIQPFLQNNSESEYYYEKLFDTIFLTEKLSNNPHSVVSQKDNLKKKKI